MKSRLFLFYLALPFALAALHSCGKNDVTKTSPKLSAISSFSIEPISMEEFDRVPPTPNAADITESTWFLSDETGVTIFATAEDVHFWHNDEIGEDYALYSFEGFFGNGQFALVEGIHLEWTTHTLVNLETAERNSFWGKPVFSKNGALVISYSFDPIAGFMPNGFQLFSLKNGTFSLLLQHEFEEWGPYEMRWESDSTLVTKRVSYNNDYEEEIDFIRVVLK